VTRTNIRRPEDTGETFEVIAKRVTKAGKSATSTEGRSGTKVNLKRASLRVAGQVFQWRMQKRNMIENDDHILDMAKQARETKAPLDPILVFPVGKEFYVMDGHHRLAAYDTARWKDDIPARVYTGTLEEAWRAALGSNTKNKLAMTKDEKLNAAWTIVKKEHPRDSVASTAKLCQVSTGTVDNMRAALKKLKKDNLVTPEEMKNLSWSRARMKALGVPEYRELGDWIEREAQKLADAIHSAKLVGRLTKNPDITAVALALVNPKLPAALMAEWQEDEEKPFDPHADAGEDLKF
jgi:hypothetical protein